MHGALISKVSLRLQLDPDVRSARRHEHQVADFCRPSERDFALKVSTLQVSSKGCARVGYLQPALPAALYRRIHVEEESDDIERPSVPHDDLLQEIDRLLRVHCCPSAWRLLGPQPVMVGFSPGS